MLSTVLRNSNLDCTLPKIIPSAAPCITFTDRIAPQNIVLTDLSVAKDGGVVRWREGDMYYISTQRSGMKVKAPKDCSFLFSECCRFIDASMLDVSNVTNMRSMFSYCQFLEHVDGLENWNVSNVVDMTCMFSNCWRLKNIDGLENWDVSSVVDMNYMFQTAISLENIDPLESWDVKNVKYMVGMFDGCKSLGADRPKWYTQ